MAARKPEEGRYSRISRRVWGSKDFRELSAPKPNAQTLWIRLLCGPECGSIPGLFELRQAGLAEALGWTAPAFRRCLAEITARGMAYYEQRDGAAIWIPKAIRHNAPANPNVVLGWRTAWKDVPDCHVKHIATVALDRWCEQRGNGWVQAFRSISGYRPPNGSPKPLPERYVEYDSDSENDSDTDTEPAAAAPDPNRPDRDPNRPDRDARVRCPVPLPFDPQVYAGLELAVGIPRPIAEAFFGRWAQKQAADAGDLRPVGAWLKCAHSAVCGEWAKDKSAMRALVAQAPPDEPERARRHAMAKAARRLADEQANARLKASSPMPATPAGGVQDIVLQLSQELK